MESLSIIWTYILSRDATGGGGDFNGSNAAISFKRAEFEFYKGNNERAWEHIENGSYSVAGVVTPVVGGPILKQAGKHVVEPTISAIGRSIDSFFDGAKVVDEGGDVAKIANGSSNALQLLPEFSNSRKAFEHYAKHSKGVIFDEKGTIKVKLGGADVPEFTSYDEYVSAARSFWAPSAREGILQGTRSDGAILRFEPSTGYFGAMENGKITTFFRPDGDSAAKLKYFMDQI